MGPMKAKRKHSKSPYQGGGPMCPQTTSNGEEEGEEISLGSAKGLLCFVILCGYQKAYSLHAFFAPPTPTTAVDVEHEAPIQDHKLQSIHTCLQLCTPKRNERLQKTLQPKSLAFFRAPSDQVSSSKMVACHIPEPDQYPSLYSPHRNDWRTP
ncbi:hypothetical protein D5086_026610 [Populus alba]|uniref:Uncharacterized protein n=1 Tax=Populus alba TaxID=43335 RepID=A0ACC4B338_POPAL